MNLHSSPYRQWPVLRKARQISCSPIVGGRWVVWVGEEAKGGAKTESNRQKRATGENAPAENAPRRPEERTRGALGARPLLCTIAPALGRGSSTTGTWADPTKVVRPSFLLLSVAVHGGFFLSAGGAGTGRACRHAARTEGTRSLDRSQGPRGYAETRVRRSRRPRILPSFSPIGATARRQRRRRPTQLAISHGGKTHARAPPRLRTRRFPSHPKRRPTPVAHEV